MPSTFDGMKYVGEAVCTMKISVAAFFLGVLSGFFFLIGFLTLFGARGVLLQIVIAMLLFVIAAQLLVGAVLSRQLWRLNRRLTRHRAYERSVGDDQAA